MLALAEKMAALDQPIRLQDLAILTGMTGSTLLRSLDPLIEHGYAPKVMDGTWYQLTIKLCGLADSIRSSVDVRTAAQQHMREIVRAFGETANLSVERDMAVQYVEAAPGPNKTFISLQNVGHTVPMHCTGAGKLFLLRYTSHEVKQYIAAKGLPRFTDHTITDPTALMKELEKVRRADHAYDNGESEDGVRSVAIPIRDYTGNITACLSVSGPVGRMSDSMIAEHFPVLVDVAARISFTLGLRKPDP